MAARGDILVATAGDFSCPPVGRFSWPPTPQSRRDAPQRTEMHAVPATLSALAGPGTRELSPADRRPMQRLAGTVTMRSVATGRRSPLVRSPPQL